MAGIGAATSVKERLVDSESLFRKLSMVPESNWCVGNIEWVEMVNTM